ncbi:class I SAM-dependent methyltransferase [Candidatus Kaiserbacteria bacterium]|nr:class I SAM-dependent methyltransferase [Candidatus Kaiserbacteria bacterium]
MKSLLSKIIVKLSSVLPDKSVEASKAEWDKLSDENHRYYIVSKKGREIDDEQFRETGEDNYRELVVGDDLLKENLGNFSDKKVLDIGCGSGRLTEFFAKDFKEAHGVGISEKMVEKARKRLAHVPNASFVSNDGEHYPFDDNTFDLVFSYIVFQHMPSRKVVLENLKEVKRVLQPSGIAKIQIRGGTEVLKGSWFYGPTFKEEDAKKLADEAGLKIVKMGDDSVKRFFLWMKKD